MEKRTTVAYRKRLAHGLATELPDIADYLYVPDQDIWIRRYSAKMRAMVGSEKAPGTYRLLEQARMLVRRDDYTSPAEAAVVPLGSVHTTAFAGLVRIRDVLGLVLAYATYRDPQTWRRLRLVSRTFRATVDDRATGADLFDPDLLSSYRKNPWKARIRSAPERVRILYTVYVGSETIFAMHRGSDTVVDSVLASKPEHRHKFKTGLLMLLQNKEARKRVVGAGHEINLIHLRKLVGLLEFSPEELDIRTIGKRTIREIIA